MQRAVAAKGSRQIYRVRRRTETDALVGAGSAGAAEHGEARRSRIGRDDVFRSPLCEARTDLDVVAGSGRQVLDIQGGHHGATPFGVGMTRDFGQRGGCSTGQADGTRGRTGSIEYVVGAVHLMRGTGN